MKVSELAKLWVFSERLEDKLFWPDSIVWDDWQPLQDIPLAPGRPSALKFSDQKTNLRFPTLYQLEKPQARGEALHFFANHELLALEIMALTILKFPQAPRSFLQGVLQTLRDEQKHMVFYLENMQRYGCEFGRIPVNSFFWQHLSSCPTPMHYASGMALTFEQANLDYSKFYQQAFEKLGDSETATALQTVFEDEIRHVAHGLHWFNRWRDPQADLWTAYKNSLSFPLTPQRAKGKVLDHEARKKAGLDEEFISQLEVYSHSVGRLPRVFFFNPDCEESNSTAKGNYQRPKFIQQLSDDLSLLPIVFAHTSDIVLLPTLPAKEHLLGLRGAGLDLAEIKLEKDFYSDHGRRALESLEPWGWTKKISERQESLQVLHRHEFHREVYSKRWSVEVLNDYVSQSQETFICSPDVVGKIVDNFSQLLDAIVNFQKIGFANIAIKAPYAASGRNIQRVRSIDFGDHLRSWIEKMLIKQEHLIVEPWLEKEFDYSLQITVPREGPPRIDGTARFLVDAEGRYKGALLGGFHQKLNQQQIRFLNDSGKNEQRLKRHFRELADFVGARAQHSNYFGPIGIDAMVYRDHEQQLRIKPIVETNCRWNMGRLVVDLEKKLRLPGAGVWQVIPYRDNLVPQLSRHFLPLQKKNFSREQYYFLQLSHSPHKKMVALLFWGPNIDEIWNRLKLCQK